MIFSKLDDTPHVAVGIGYTIIRWDLIVWNIKNQINNTWIKILNAYDLLYLTMYSCKMLSEYTRTKC